jgi:hypothetical protein
MANPWISHLKAFWSKNKGKMSYKAAMQAARKSYTPIGKNEKNGSYHDVKKKVKRRRKRK